MKEFLFSLLGMMLVVCSANAQVVKGDMNDDGDLNVSDITSLVNQILTNKKEYGPAIDKTANKEIEGIWMRNKNYYIIFDDADSAAVYDYNTCYYYKYNYYPALNKILLYNRKGAIRTIVVKSKTDTSMDLLIPGDTYLRTYNVTSADAPIETISLSTDKKTLFTTNTVIGVPADTTIITASILPAFLTNKELEWSITQDFSTTRGISKVRETANSITVRASRNSGATITATAKDGSGVSASIHIEAKERPRPKAVDLGLPSGLKWADCNVGAKTPEENGLYFAWGETTGYLPSDGHWFKAENYKWYGGNSYTYTKYVKDEDSKYYDGKSVLDIEDDGARAFCGGTWRMPTRKEIEELINNCTWTLTTNNDVKVYKVEGKNGNSIFLPYVGRYWLSSANCYLAFYDDYLGKELIEISGWEAYRYIGYPIRAVCE